MAGRSRRLVVVAVLGGVYDLTSYVLEEALRGSGWGGFREHRQECLCYFFL